MFIYHVKPGKTVMSDEGYYDFMARPVRMNYPDTVYHVLSRVSSGRALLGKILSRAGLRPFPPDFFRLRVFGGNSDPLNLRGSGHIDF